ncbi:phosphotransferase [Pseudoalteromonas sp. SSDWG2]|uniref:phosphotransferase n=1 Tax=Pseudoalteromonas sp. SSDWG2 TaxID=3139391 RepID=UPI003BACCB62
MPESVGRIRELVAAFAPDIQINQITFLPQGVSNENYRVDTPDRILLVKLYGRALPDAAIKAQHALAKLGVCPEPFYVDAAHPVAIFDYLPGTMATQFDHHQAVTKLVQIHRYQANTERLDLHYELHQYRNEAFYQDYAAQLESVVQQTRTLKEDWCFCHNDLIKENVISHRQQWHFIDFEYAQLSDRYFDLAMLTLSFELSAREQQVFFSHYFNAIKLTGNWQKFKAMQKLVAALNYFWYERQGVQQRVAGAKAQLDKLLG